MLHKIFSALALFSAGSRLGSMLTIRDCAIDSSVFRLNTLGLTPANPVAGQNVTLSVEYTVPDGYYLPAGGGNVLYDVTVNFVPLPQSVAPLCSVIPCPLAPGVYFNESVSAWPSGLTGKMTSKIRWKDANDALLACIQISGSLSRAKNKAEQLQRQLMKPVLYLEAPPVRAKPALRKM